MCYVWWGLWEGGEGGGCGRGWEACVVEPGGAKGGLAVKIRVCVKGGGGRARTGMRVWMGSSHEVCLVLLFVYTAWCGDVKWVFHLRWICPDVGRCRVTSLLMHTSPPALFSAHALWCTQPPYHVLRTRSRNGFHKSPVHACTISLSRMLEWKKDACG